jgi:hypothetical protein
VQLYGYANLYSWWPTFSLILNGLLAGGSSIQATDAKMNLAFLPTFWGASKHACPAMACIMAADM